MTSEERKRKFQAMERRELKRGPDGSMELVEKAPVLGRVGGGGAPGSGGGMSVEVGRGGECARLCA